MAEARFDAADARLSAARLVVFAAGGILVWLAMWRGLFTAWWLALPMAIFAGLMVWHDRVIHRRERARRAAEWYERGLARMADRWTGTGETGDRFLDEQHPYAGDLDLFGRGSLFELLSTSRTSAGEAVLAQWLLDGAPPDTVRQRQSAARDLAPRVDLREDMAVAGIRLRREVRPEALRGWAAAPALMPPGAVRSVAVGFTFVTVSTCAAWLGGVIDGAYVVRVVAAQIVFALALRRRVEHVLHGSEGPARELLVLGEVLHRLERERFDAPLLQRLHASLGERPRASRAIRSLGRLMDAHDWQHNQVFAPVAGLLLWGTHLAFAVDAWRVRYGAAVAQWLALVGDVEALASLGTYTFEHPTDVFPDIVDGPARFEARGLAHPLLPRTSAVTNDVALQSRAEGAPGAAPALMLVSGSNMSGKSTLLRTVGINTVLALAGAPVRAATLTLAPMSIGATLRLQDSLAAGRSRFYAEITRLRQLRDLATGPRPLLFLLDELFHGTNSHDRVAGAAGVLRAFINLGAIGLVTTHDLALSALVTDLGPRAANVHFEDQFVEGEMRFDYCLRPGPVTRSNALALMRAVGLDVPDAMHVAEAVKKE